MIIVARYHTVLTKQEIVSLNDLQKGLTKMTRNTLFYFPFVTLFSGCSLFPGSQPVKPVQVEKYSDISTLIEAEFPDTIFFQVKDGALKNGFLPYNEEAFYRPINALRSFCQQYSNKLEQLERGYVENRSTDIFFKNTGLFSCQNDKDIAWMARIEMSNPGYSNRDVRALQVQEVNVEEYISMLHQRANAVQESIMRKDNMERLFDSGRSENKVVGQTVCSWDNYLGYVESVSNDRIKVLVKAKANTFEKGVFFDQTTSKLSVTRLNDLLWSDYRDWAACTYDVSLR